MSRKGPEVGQGILDFEEDCHVGVKSHYKYVIATKCLCLFLSKTQSYSKLIKKMHTQQFD